MMSRQAEIEAQAAVVSADEASLADSRAKLDQFISEAHEQDEETPTALAHWAGVTRSVIYKSINRHKARRLV